MCGNCGSGGPVFVEIRQVIPALDSTVVAVWCLECVRNG